MGGKHRRQTLGCWGGELLFHEHINWLSSPVKPYRSICMMERVRSNIWCYLLLKYSVECDTDSSSAVKWMSHSLDVAGYVQLTRSFIVYKRFVSVTAGFCGQGQLLSLYFRIDAHVIYFLCLLRRRPPIKRRIQSADVDPHNLHWDDRFYSANMRCRL